MEVWGEGDAKLKVNFFRSYRDRTRRSSTISVMTSSNEIAKGS